MTMNVIFAGVGGQGVILATKILMEVAKNAGYDVKESEIHGMAQRGGSVECNVRYSNKVYSPLIEKGTADYIVAFEMLEIMRKLDYLAPDGMVIVNQLQIDPSPVQIGAMEYPGDLADWLNKNAGRKQIVDTEAALKELGSRKSLNIVMLGVLSKHLEFTEAQWMEGIRSQVKESFLEMNAKAFALGRAM
jgi:indolepyruvate ferredoxin oxidoreductase beta subunit